MMIIAETISKHYRVSDSHVIKLRCVSSDFKKIERQFSMRINHRELDLSIIKNINSHWKLSLFIEDLIDFA